MPLLFGLCGLLLLLTSPATAATLELTGPARAHDLLAHSVLLHDPTGTLTAAGALAVAAPPGLPRPPLRLDGGRYWLVVTVHNRTTEPDWVLRTGNVLFNSIELYRFTAGRLSGYERVGRTLAETTTSIELAYHLAVSLPPGQSQSLVLRLEAQVFNQIMADLVPTARARHDDVWRQVLVLTVFGVILALVLYNFFLALSLRSDTYLWYALHGSCLVVYFLTAFGLMHRLFGYSDPALYLLSPFMLATLLFSLLFHYRFLAIPALSPCLQRGYGLMGVLLLGQLLVYPWLTPVQGAVLARLSQLLVGPFILASVVVAVRRGFRPARYVLVGWGVLITVSIWGTLSLVGVFRFSMQVAPLVLLATAFEMITLSLALGDRIRQLQQAKAQAEEQVQANTLFIAMLSHEVRHPLAAIMGLVTLLDRTRLSAEQRDYLHFIDQSGHALLDTLDSLLDQFRQQPDRLQVQRRSFELRPLVSGALDLYRAAARSQRVTLSVQFDPTLPAFVQGDPVRLRQVLLNLLGNAVKYSPEGQVTVTVQRVGDAAAATATVQFAVADTGTGMPGTDSRLFQPFYRRPEAVQSGAPGLGLGLAVSQTIVAALGGTIVCTSRPGQGSTFRFTLTFPVGQAPIPPAKPVAVPAPQDILLVDDDALVREIVQRLLEQDGQRVTAVASGEQALAVLAERRFDLVVLDMQLPGLDGLETARRIRSQDQHCLIVGLTAGDIHDRRAASLYAGMDALLAKPLDRAALYRLTTPAEPTPAPLIKHAVAAGHREALGERVWGELLAQFQAQAPRYLDELAEAVRQQQLAEVRVVAHRLAGMADSLGFARLAAAAAAIEKRPLQSTEEVLPALAALGELYQDTVMELL